MRQMLPRVSYGLINMPHFGREKEKSSIRRTIFDRVNDTAQYCS